MKNSSNHIPFLSGIFSLALTLSACGGGGDDTPLTGGNSGGETTTTDPVGIVVTPEGGDEGGTADNGPPTVSAAGPLITASVDPTKYNLYKVPSGSQVLLTVTSGNASLYLYNSLELEDENELCYSGLGFKESACSATVDDGELYALVYGRVATDYTISATFDCSVPAVNAWVDRGMRDYYLYADQTPTVNTASYDSTEALLDELRFDSLDPYSNIRNAQTQSDFSEQGITRSFGYSWKRDNAGEARISMVYKDSPFGRAGIKRSDIIVAINGELWDEMSSERYTQLIGTNDNPLSTTWTFIDGESGERKNIVAQLEEFTVNTVLHTDILTHSEYSGSVGYIMFRSFIETSETELDAEFKRFKEQGITDLILDLRYNGGGRTRIARLLASKIAGPFTDEKKLVTYQYNNKYTDRNFSRFFEPESNALGLERLVVITSERTASSSELVINSLRPYIEVVTIGSKTEGKPYISTSNTFCGKTLNAMEAQGVNDNGVGVAGGITADCYAADDVTRDFGINPDTNALEGMLRPAAEYLVFGRCDAAPQAKTVISEAIAVEQEYVSELARRAR